MLITSKFPGFCKTCKGEIRVGDRVSWVKGIKGVSHASCSEEGKALAKDLEASHATDTHIDIPCPDGLSYLGYQKAGIAYALDCKEGTLIGDEMGLGKTIQAIGYVNASPDVRRVLIVCPASLKLNWRNELRKWLVQTALIVVWPAPGIASSSGLQIDIVNYDILKKLPKTATFDLLILDEAHYVKNPKSQRSKLVQDVKKRSKKVIALTGTPIANRPVELFPILQLVAPEAWDPAGLKGQEIVPAGGGAGFFRYAKRYCNAHKQFFGRKSFWDFTGSSNLIELQERLRTTCMVRRLKKDVLTELPPKVRQTIVLPKSQEAEDESAMWYEGYDDIEDLTRAKAKLAFTEISAARRKLAISKVPAVVEHVRDALESSEKIVLFAHHKEVVAALMSELSEFNPVQVTGDTDTYDRQANVDTFQLNPDCRLIIGSIGAMGVGLTLTASSHVIFAELDWVPANMSQAEDRCHRIGQRGSVLVQHLVVEGSLDARMVELVIQKQQIADLALDTETLQDVSDRRKEAPKKSREDVCKELGIDVSNYEIEMSKTRARLAWLASRCDGAHVEDGAGFNKLDAQVGRKLAQLESFTPNQLAFGRLLLKKYRGQLERGGML